MDFDDLLNELAPLHKALPANADGDAKVLAAAEEGGADTGTVTDEGAENEDGVLGKSFQVTMPDGSVQEAFDVADLVKSFSVRLDAAETVAAEHKTAAETNAAELAKSLTVSAKLVDMVKGQSALIKSLQDDVKRIGTQPVGRRATISVTERGSPTPPAAARLNGEQIMAKAMSLVGDGGLSSSDIATVEMSLQRGMEIPPHIAAALSL